jgi:hypothetical protein
MVHVKWYAKIYSQNINPISNIQIIDRYFRKIVGSESAFILCLSFALMQKNRSGEPPKNQG